MPLVALDANVIDLFAAAIDFEDAADRLEAMRPPPQLVRATRQLEAEAYACYWLLALAPRWYNTRYTFSDQVYVENAFAPEAARLAEVAVEVLVRDYQPAEYRVPDPTKRPDARTIGDLGIRSKDGEHVADAVALNCDFLLTNDLRLRNKSDQVETRWGLKLRRPSEFLIGAVRSGGAPWTCNADWPWVTIEAIRAGAYDHCATTSPG
ncbi:MAG: hypothetical protein R2698_15185 [Microthrixaceae bacterium]